MIYTYLAKYGFISGTGTYWKYIQAGNKKEAMEIAKKENPSWAMKVQSLERADKLPF